MSTVKKKTTSRVEAGLVEEDFEAQPNDEALADGSWIDPDAEGFSQTNPSETRISGMSEEEQSMDMTPVVVGPPAYGSPNPETAAGRLLPLDQHPFNPEALPEDHPVRIDPEYGKGYQADLTAAEIGSQFPGAPQRTDLERDLAGTEEEEATDYNAQTKDELLTEASARGLDVTSSNTKAEIVAALEEDDATA